VDLVLDIEVLSILAQDVHKNQGCKNSCAHYPTNLSFQNQFCNNIDEFLMTKMTQKFNIFQSSSLKIKKSSP
jgi:hypothetical protein